VLHQFPLLINIPSLQGEPDCVAANNIIGSLTTKFLVFIVDDVPKTLKLAFIVTVFPSSVILLLPTDDVPVHFVIVFKEPFPTTVPGLIIDQLDVCDAVNPDK
jgi:hypothetical protein